MFESSLLRLGSKHAHKNQAGTVVAGLAISLLAACTPPVQQSSADKPPAVSDQHSALTATLAPPCCANLTRKVYTPLAADRSNAHPSLRNRPSTHFRSSRARSAHGNSRPVIHLANCSTRSS
jgi:hypothetical protein